MLTKKVERDSDEDEDDGVYGRQQDLSSSGESGRRGRGMGRGRGRGMSHTSGGGTDRRSVLSDHCFVGQITEPDEACRIDK